MVRDDVAVMLCIAELSFLSVAVVFLVRRLMKTALAYDSSWWNWQILQDLECN